MTVKWLTKGLAAFRRKGERFLVVEIFEHNNRAAYIQADFQNKAIKFVKVLSHLDLGKLLKKFGRLSKYKIILSLDSHLASTIYSSVVLVRENYKELVDEPELDNLISQAIWKFFDRQRNKVSAKLGVTDLDIVLTDVKIRGIKLDGHKVVNPMGFKAKTVEVQFSQTFLVREYINKLKELLPLTDGIFAAENGTAFASVMSKSNPKDNFLIANIFKNKTLLFLFDGSQSGYLDKFNWGEDNLNKSLASDLSVESDVAGLVIHKYLRNEVSQSFKRRLEGLLLKELAFLARGLNVACKKTDAETIYLHPFFNFPAIFSGSFRSHFDRQVDLSVLDHQLISKNFGFDIKFKNSGDVDASFSFLASLLEWYLSPHEDKMSQLAKRRVRWLSSL